MNSHYALVGTFTKDLVPGGYTLGGTVFYSGVQARRLGWVVSILSTAEPDLDLNALEPGIQAMIQPSPQSTTFENIYDAAGNRTQYLRASAAPLRPESAALLTLAPDILHLGPLAGEVPQDYGRYFPGAKLAITPQGWMRGIAADGRVFPRRWDEAEQVLPGAWAMVFSEEDVGYDADEIQRLGELCRVCVCTRNYSAAILFTDGRRSEVPAIPAKVIDPTGAGDVFAAAFFVALYESADPEWAVRFAHVAAAASIEGQGVSRVLGRAEVLARLGRLGFV